jgi:hypothetical protein
VLARMSISNNLQTCAVLICPLCLSTSIVLAVKVAVTRLRRLKRPQKTQRPSSSRPARRARLRTSSGSGAGGRATRGPSVSACRKDRGRVAAASGSVLSAQKKRSRAGPVLPILQTGQLGAAYPPTATYPVPVAGGGGVGAQVLFSGRAPGFLGLYQVNIVIPGAAPTGSVNLDVVVDGTPSQTSKVVVQ